MRLFKNIYTKIVALLLLFTVAACVNEDEVNQERDGKAGTPGLVVVVTDATAAVVAGADVTLYATQSDYIAETNPVLTKVTDADGEVSFSADEMGGEPGIYYFSVASGMLRNWSSTTNAGYMYLTSGPTRIKTTVAPVLQQFIDLIDGDWIVTSYTYPGPYNAWTDTGINPACAADDIFRFLKTGQCQRREGATSCGAPNADQAPVSVAGSNWSPWALNATGTQLVTFRDLDPDFETATQTGKAYGLTINPGVSITIDYGGGYVATLERP